MKYMMRYVSKELKLIDGFHSIRLYGHERSQKLIDGKFIANKCLDQLKFEISRWIDKGNKAPHLSVLMFEGNPSSESYVKMKCKAADFVGITTELQMIPKTTLQTDFLKTIDHLNKNSNVDGILVQLPLSKNVDLRRVCNAICPTKDVDGFTPYSLGKLCLNEPNFIPCTALAVHHIISSLGVKMTGKKAVVCGRSKHVGLPIAVILHSSLKLGKFEGLNMSTTICHRHTPLDHLTTYARNADVLISAVGQPNLIRGDMIKPGALVIDVGFTEVLKGDKRRVVGDINKSEVKEIAGMISPVPGGVGPVTVAMLMYNTFAAAKNRSESLGVCKVAPNVWT